MSAKKMTPRKKKLITWTVVGAAVLLNPLTLLMLWLGTAAWSNSHPDQGENLEHVDWLPPSAKDISYYLTYSRKAFECNMTESDLREFAAERDYRLSEIQEPRSIARYNWLRANMDANNLGCDEDDALLDVHTARVNHGLYSQHIQSNGGGYHLIFDRDHGRVYFDSAPR